MSRATGLSRRDFVKRVGTAAGAAGAVGLPGMSEVAASVGCALSRARTGLRPEEMTCAIPGRKLGEVVSALEAAVTLDRMMASYAAADAKRFL